MVENTLPLQMQYLGSKGRISEWIITQTKKSFPTCTKFFDLFSGTGAVAQEALNRGFRVSANDFESYSYCVIQSILTSHRTDTDKLLREIAILKEDNSLLQNGRRFMRNLLEEERQYFDQVGSDNFHWERYKDFCEETPVISGTKEEIDQLRRETDWNLFSHYYTNTYFGVKQCLQLDALRQAADTQREHIKNDLLAAAISAMTYGVSSTTHLAQYLRPNSRIKAIHLANRRKFDFIDEIQRRLVRLKYFNVPAQHVNVYNMDYLSALDQEELNMDWIIYVDPPYFKEHYSRYYHVLNTFYLYDYPYLTFNPRTGRVTEGRYRQDRNVSRFGKRSSVLDAFSDLFDRCRQLGFKLVISYAETSLVKKNNLIELSEEAGLSHRISETSLMHSSQGKYSNKRVTEYLLCFESKGNK